MVVVVEGVVLAGDGAGRAGGLGGRRRFGSGHGGGGGGGAVARFAVGGSSGQRADRHPDSGQDYQQAQGEQPDAAQVAPETAPIVGGVAAWHPLVPSVLATSPGHLPHHHPAGHTTPARCAVASAARARTRWSRSTVSGSYE